MELENTYSKIFGDTIKDEENEKEMKLEKVGDLSLFFTYLFLYDYLVRYEDFNGYNSTIYFADFENNVICNITTEKNRASLLKIIKGGWRRIIELARKFIGKAYAYTVEHMNRLLCHYLERFARKTYCQSKSPYMIENSIFLFMERDLLPSIRF